MKRRLTNCEKTYLFIHQTYKVILHMCQFLIERFIYSFVKQQCLNKARFFILVDLQEIFFRFRVRGAGKKALKVTGQLFIFRAFSLICPEQTIKLV